GGRIIVAAVGRAERQAMEHDELRRSGRPGSAALLAIDDKLLAHGVLRISRNIALMAEQDSLLPQEQARRAFGDLVERKTAAGAIPGPGPVHGAEDEQAHELRVARHMAGALELVDHLLPQRVVAVLEFDDAA